MVPVTERVQIGRRAIGPVHPAQDGDAAHDGWCLPGDVGHHADGLNEATRLVASLRPSAWWPTSPGRHQPSWAASPSCAGCTGPIARRPIWTRSVTGTIDQRATST